jgi:hypothetical protein
MKRHRSERAAFFGLVGTITAAHSNRHQQDGQASAAASIWDMHVQLVETDANMED